MQARGYAHLSIDARAAQGRQEACANAPCRHGRGSGSGHVAIGLVGVACVGGCVCGGAGVRERSERLEGVSVCNVKSGTQNRPGHEAVHVTHICGPGLSLPGPKHLPRPAGLQAREHSARAQNTQATSVQQRQGQCDRGPGSAQPMTHAHDS